MEAGVSVEKPLVSSKPSAVVVGPEAGFERSARLGEVFLDSPVLVQGKEMCAHSHCEP